MENQNVELVQQNIQPQGGDATDLDDYVIRNGLTWESEEELLDDIRWEQKVERTYAVLEATQPDAWVDDSSVDIPDEMPDEWPDDLFAEMPE